jgi:hypothetical protein
MVARFDGIESLACAFQHVRMRLVRLTKAVACSYNMAILDLYVLFFRRKVPKEARRVFPSTHQGLIYWNEEKYWQ